MDKLKRVQIWNALFDCATVGVSTLTIDAIDGVVE
jgi:hypothetical protein